MSGVLLAVDSVKPTIVGLNTALSRRTAGGGLFLLPGVDVIKGWRRFAGWT
jgi:hypothetical protein